MKRTKTRAKTRKRTGGVPNQCVTACSYQCEGNCRYLCNVSKRDTAYHSYYYEKLKEKKKELVDKLERDNKGKVKDLLKESKLSTNEQEDLRKILENEDIGYSPKQLLLKMYREKQAHVPLLFQATKGGFNHLTDQKIYSDCEGDCRERCSESCEYLCDESVNKLSSMYKKETDVLESEISVLKEVQKLIRVV
jgi:hypothetical protein